MAQVTMKVRCRGVWFLYVMVWVAARILRLAAWSARWCFRLGISFVLVELDGRPYGRVPVGRLGPLTTDALRWEKRVHELVRSAGEWDAISEAGR